jgi:hypothetical protein
VDDLLGEQAVWNRIEIPARETEQTRVGTFVGDIGPQNVHVHNEFILACCTERAFGGAPPKQTRRGIGPQRRLVVVQRRGRMLNAASMSRNKRRKENFGRRRKQVVDHRSNKDKGQDKIKTIKGWDTKDKEDKSSNTATAGGVGSTSTSATKASRLPWNAAGAKHVKQRRRELPSLGVTDGGRSPEAEGRGFLSSRRCMVG